jgi:hypothetical protein
MARAVDRGLKPGVNGCLSKGMTYGQSSFIASAIDSRLPLDDELGGEGHGEVTERHLD